MRIFPDIVVNGEDHWHKGFHVHIGAPAQLWISPDDFFSNSFIKLAIFHNLAGDAESVHYADIDHLLIGQMVFHSDLSLQYGLHMAHVFRDSFLTVSAKYSILSLW